MRQLLFKELLLLVVIVMLLLLLYSVLQLLRLMAVMLLLLLLNPASVGLLEDFASTHVLTFKDTSVVEVVIEV